jgi:hypothetical protein
MTARSCSLALAWGFVLLQASAALAGTFASPTPGVLMEAMVNPCKKVRMACDHAGRKGPACFKDIKAGKIQGLTVADLDACQHPHRAAPSPSPSPHKSSP